MDNWKIISEDKDEENLKFINNSKMISKYYNWKPPIRKKIHEIILLKDKNSQLFFFANIQESKKEINPI
jgi:hypothetical protein